MEETEKLEVLFTVFSDIDPSALRLLPRLTHVSLLNNGLRALPSLLPAAQQLTNLSINHNLLASMSRLPDLPCLVELSLAFNRIAAIERLAACPRLRVLRLSGNEISVLSPLSCAPLLLEVFLEENRVVTLSSVPPLKHLRALHLAGNPIEQPLELRHLAPLFDSKSNAPGESNDSDDSGLLLPALEAISFRSPDHPDAAVVGAAGGWRALRRLALLQLPQLRSIDGIAVDEVRPPPSLRQN